MWKIVLVAGFVLFAAATEIVACTCSGVRDVVAQAASSQVVFTGRVVATKTVFVSGDGATFARETVDGGVRRMRIAVFDVIELLKGDVAPLATVVTGFGDADCGYVFEEGKSYLVFLERTKDAEVVAVAATNDALTTSICSGTRSIGDGASLPHALTAAHPPRRPLRFITSPN